MTVYVLMAGYHNAQRPTRVLASSALAEAALAEARQALPGTSPWVHPVVVEPTPPQDTGGVMDEAFR